MFLMGGMYGLAFLVIPKNLGWGASVQPRTMVTFAAHRAAAISDIRSFPDHLGHQDGNSTVMYIQGRIRVSSAFKAVGSKVSDQNVTKQDGNSEPNG
jgi:hypothetical protein